MPSSQLIKTKQLLKKSSGVIFDFDGLLADSEPYHYLAYNEVFQRYGHSLDRDEYWIEWTSKGKGIAGEIDRHNLHLGVDPIQLRQQKFEIYSQYCQNGNIQLFPESIEVIKLLKTSYPVAIASGSWEHDISAILKNAQAEYLFDKILGKGSAEKEKPHPEIFLNAAKVLQCLPSQCIVIEDALKGLSAAKAAGMSCIIIRNQLNQKIDFSEADLTFSNLSSFLNILKF
ncbi:MAG: HAD family phosphatase [Nitrospina sp.]|nr:HAD family phosphatase [Nitrospina sp.]MBT6601561.1 HAD family phosphatase [Nitrospina sp.]